MKKIFYLIAFVVKRCTQVCEPQCIKLFPSGTGVYEWTPFIAPEKSACTLCFKCGEACPTGVIQTLQEKKEAQMGTAVVDEQLCVSHNGTGICGACFTICPLHGKAITQGLRNKTNCLSRILCGLWFV